MNKPKVELSGVERKLSENDIIVSKTDKTGKITYVNKTFVDISRYSEEELLGAPHSIIRHPRMPRCVFKLLWDRLGAGDEVFAYVLNLARDGAEYWVLAHVSPSRDSRGTVLGYHSNRRYPNPEAVAVIKPVYESLLEIERKNGDTKDGMLKAEEHFKTLLASAGQAYDEFIFSLISKHSK